MWHVLTLTSNDQTSEAPTLILDVAHRMPMGMGRYLEIVDKLVTHEHMDRSGSLPVLSREALARPDQHGYTPVHLLMRCNDKAALTPEGVCSRKKSGNKSGAPLHVHVVTRRYT